TVVFLKPEEDSPLLSSKEVRESLSGQAEVFAMFASLKLESGNKMEGLPVLYEFPDVFPGDVSDVPPERKVEFSIDLIP
ncbi:cellular nucleic acid-binding protein, partial [Trifolium medium]|nr:cellular nucleic acid-binding protein [Trifolium medium]